MIKIGKQDKKAARDVLELLLSVLPESARDIQHIAYTFGLICRETDIKPEQATDLITSWGERLRALPNFTELFPLYHKPSRYRYTLRHTVQNAYTRTEDKPSSEWVKALTGKEPPEASFWVNIPPSHRKVKVEKKTKKPVKSRAGKTGRKPARKPSRYGRQEKT